MEITIKEFSELLDNKYIIVESFREHSKASEKYIDVTFVQKDGYTWKGSIPYFYRRTGLFIETANDLVDYLNEIYPHFTKSEIEKFKADGNATVKAATDFEETFSATDWNAWNEEEQQAMLLNYRLAYLSDTWVNWCPALGTVLANDEIKNGVSERGGHPVEQKLMRQWSMRITAYAERLLNDLDTVDWTDSIKDIQRNWIGKSVGASVKFKVLSPTLSKGEGDTTPKYLTGDNNNAHLLLENAKEMRSNPTPAEDALWQQLKGKKIGAKFRRQHPIDNFIADFVCLDKKLIIEVDGKIHDSQKEADQQRTDVLNDLGYQVIRFKNEAVLVETENVITQITSSLAQRPSIKDEPKVLPQGKDLGWEIEVFTTRPDTIYGVSFMVLAPEHELVAKITTADQKDKIEAYQKAAAAKSERDRMSDVKTISGEFTGAYAIHPFSGEKIPVWIGDYVLASYGTGAVMAVPCGDQRDWDFAKYFNIDIPNIFKDKDIDRIAKSMRMKSGKFIEQYLQRDEDYDYVLQTAPCSFLNDDNTCSIYDVRPNACKEYPHTNRKKMYQLMPLTLKNTEVCPATLKIVEQVKLLMGS